MLTFIAFALSVAGCINWLLIGILQYDYIAGFFGFQASIMSRIFYVLFGIGAIYLVLRVIINKGTFKVFERKKKKEKEEKRSKQEEKQAPAMQMTAAANVEASKEITPQPLISSSSINNFQQKAEVPPDVHFENLRSLNTVNKEEKTNPAPETAETDSLFDEHMQGKL